MPLLDFVARPHAPKRLSLPLLFLSGLALAGTYLLNPDAALMTWIQIAIVLAGLGLLVSARGQAPSFPADRVIIGTAVLSCAVLAYGAAAVWPISGDEYGYLYLADTLLHGRLYNPPPPLPDVFNLYWIGMRDGKSASQYPPGWPTFLAIFRAMHLEPLANPALVGGLGLLLSSSMKRLGVSPNIRLPLLALILLSPFTLFNGASLFSHLLAAVATMAVCFLQIRDDSAPGSTNKLLIGLALSILLVTRHDCFMILAPMFAVDRLLRRRSGAAIDGIPIALGGLPLTLLWLCYNWAVTGNPLLTTMLWASPDDQTFGTGGLKFLLDNQLHLLTLMLVFSGPLVLALYIAALCTRMLVGLLRFYDLLLPAAVLFFMFYPHDAGNQYGPRYWYFAWPPVSLTIAVAMSKGKSRLRLEGLAIGQMMVFFGFVAGYAPFVRLYAAERQAVFSPTPSQTPAIVLVPDRKFALTQWQSRWLRSFARDFTRNGIDFNGPVLYGRADEDRFPKMACSLVKYHVYIWHEGATLREVNCAGHPQ